MPIRFTCSHCSKSLTVRDELAGKRGRCPYCKQVVMVPASRATAPVRDPKKPDAESLALAALGVASGETVALHETAASPPKPIEHIKVTCSWCDHVFEVESTLAGKQTPCPECRRIIRVPAPQKSSPKDWRQMAHGPAAAAMSQPRLEGEWGTVTARSYVSAEALEEAEVLPVEREPLTLGQWALRISGVVSVVVLVYLGYRWYSAHRTSSLQNSLLTEAEAALGNSQFTPEQIALVHLSLVQYWQHAEPDGNRVRGVSRQARQHAAAAFQEIRKLIAQRDWSSLLAAQDLTVEYLAQCCTAGLLTDDIQKGIEQLQSFPNRDQLACQVIHRIKQKANGSDKQTAALRRFCRPLATTTSLASNKPVQDNRLNVRASPQDKVSSTVLVVATECATLGLYDIAKEILEPCDNSALQTIPASRQTGQTGGAAVLKLEGPSEVVRRLASSGTQHSFTQPREEIEYLARKGQLQDAWESYRNKLPVHSNQLERFAVFRVLAECALLHGSQETKENLLTESEKFIAELPHHLRGEAQILRVRLATAAGKEDIVKQIIEQPSQKEWRQALILAWVETLLRCRTEYLPPENLTMLSELPPRERTCLLHRLAWHNLRMDRNKTQRWFESLSGADRAIVAAVLLAGDSASLSR